MRGSRAADQRLSFHYLDRTIPLLPKSKSSSLWPLSVAVQPSLCRTCSETQKTGFLAMQLIKTKEYLSVSRTVYISGDYFVEFEWFYV